MKRTSWKTALCCVFALSLGTLGLFDRGSDAAEANAAADSQRGRGGDRGGNRGGGGDRGGARPQAGGGAFRAQPSQGGTHFGGRGAIHAPPMAAPRHSAGAAGQHPSPSRAPLVQPSEDRYRQTARSRQHTARHGPTLDGWREPETPRGGTGRVMDSPEPCAAAIRVYQATSVSERRRAALPSPDRRSSTGPSPATRSWSTTATSTSAATRTSRPITGTPDITVTGTAIEALAVVPPSDMDLVQVRDTASVRLLDTVEPMAPVGVGAWEVATDTEGMEVTADTEATVIARSVGDWAAGDSGR